MVYFEKSETIRLSHGKDVRMLRQQMRKYINDLMIDLQKFGTIKCTRRGDRLLLPLFLFCLVWFGLKKIGLHMY